MKGFSRYSGIEFRPRSLSDLIARVLIELTRFGAFSVDCRSNGLFVRQTFLPIFSILILCRSYPNAARWVETFLCVVGYPDDVEAISSLVTRSLELRFSFPLCLEVSLHFGFSGLTLLTSGSMDPSSFTLTLSLTGLAPNPVSKLSCHIRPGLPHKERLHALKVRGKRCREDSEARILPSRRKAK
jgi:hypothetical protein